MSASTLATQRITTSIKNKQRNNHHNNARRPIVRQADGCDASGHGVPVGLRGHPALHSHEFCLSGRVFERSLSENALSLDEFFNRAAKNGFTSVELRDSQIGVDSATAEIDKVLALSEKHGMRVELITARKGRLDKESDFPVFIRYLELAKNIKCAQIKVSGGDHHLLRKAAEEASKAGIKVGTNNHIGTPWETKAGALESLSKIGHPNFHLLLDPSHLWLKSEVADEDFLDAALGKISFVILQDYVVGEGTGFSEFSGKSVRPVSLGQRGEVGYPDVISSLERRGCCVPLGLVYVGNGDKIPASSLELKAHCSTYVRD